MSKQAISVGGEEKMVREDTAKSHRGVIWALISVGVFIVIGLILFLGGFLSSAFDDGIQSPAQIEQKRQ